MATLSDFLRRVRPVAAPGPPARAGVPVDRAAQLAEELAPVFAALRSTQEQATAVVTDAHGEEDRRRAAGRTQVDAVLANARQQADAARAQAASAAVEAAQAERDELVHQAQEDATALARRADERLPALTARIVGMVASMGRERGGER